MERRKKRILINGRFSSHHFAIRNVIFNITKHLSLDGGYDVYVVLNKDSEIEEFKSLDVRIVTNPCKADSAAMNHLYTMFVFPFILMKYKIDLVIYPQICIYLFNPCRSILYMHDLIEYYVDSQNWKKMLFRKLAYPYVCKLADGIVAVSENTKKDIISILKVRPDKVYVNYDGADDRLAPVSDTVARAYVEKKFGIDQYVFYIGYLTHPQKNLIYLIDEFERFHTTHSDYSLVFSGPKGKHAEQILTRAARLGANFHYLGKVDYEDLQYLYSACEVFCFPSLYEGFGMPVLEAMACGAPVITSNRSSLPEILPDAEWLIDPEKTYDLSVRLSDIVGCSRTEISKKNIDYAKNFSWRKHGERLKTIIKQYI